MSKVATTKRKGSADKILYLLKTRGAMTAPMLAELLDMTSMGARKLLLLLEEQGLVSNYYDDSLPGKPKQFWGLTDAAQQRFPDRHSDMTLDLIVQIRQSLGEDALNSVIQSREQTILKRYKAELGERKSLRGKLKRLTELRSAEGYMAEYSRQSDGSYLLAENHCPICIAATACQGFCRSELQIFREALQANVERVEYLLDGARRCAYKVWR